MVLDGTLSGRRTPLRPLTATLDRYPANPADRMMVRSSSVPPAQAGLDFSSLLSLSSRLVAFHFCQIDDNASCHVPEIVHSIAAQLTQSVSQYADYLNIHPDVATLVSLNSCFQDPVAAMRKGILAPLTELRSQKSIDINDIFVIVIDGLGDAEYHRADHGDTVASFLLKVIKLFPPWLKFVCTVRSSHLDLVNSFKWPIINLDQLATNECIHRDIESYVMYRARTSDDLMNNIAMDSYDFAAFGKFSSYLETLSNGCLLYCKLVLDLIEQGHLVLKSTNYRILPMNLSEVFLLMTNLRFPTVRSFERMLPVLNVCLASLYPLTGEQLYDVVSAGTVPLHQQHQQATFSSSSSSSSSLGNTGTKEEFTQRLLPLCPSLLFCRQDGKYVFTHNALREWFIGRRERQSSKFQCDIQ